MKENNIVIDFNKKESLDIYIEYKKQYISLIMLALKDNNFEDYIIPCINLIYQFIENELKAFILQFYSNDDWNVISMEILTHNIKKLCSDEFLYRKEFKKITFFNKIYLKLSKSVDYFYNLLGNDTFFSSRYPVKKVENKKAFNKISINKLEFKNNFFNFITAMDYMWLIYNAYLIFQCSIIMSRLKNRDLDVCIEKNFKSFTEKETSNNRCKLIKDIIQEFKKNTPIQKINN